MAPLDEQEVTKLGTSLMQPATKRSSDLVRESSALPRPSERNPRPSEYASPNVAAIDTSPSTNNSAMHRPMGRTGALKDVSHQRQCRIDFQQGIAALKAGRQRRSSRPRTAVSGEKGRVFKLGCLKGSKHLAYGCLNASGEMWLGTKDAKGSMTSAGVRLRRISDENVQHARRFQGLSHWQVEEMVSQISQTIFGPMVQDGEV